MDRKKNPGKVQAEEEKKYRNLQADANRFIKQG